MYSNNQNRGRSVPGRKKRRETFTAKEINPLNNHNSNASVSSHGSGSTGRGGSLGRNKNRTGRSPAPRRSSMAASPVKGTRSPNSTSTSSRGRRTPISRPQVVSPPRRQQQPQQQRRASLGGRQPPVAPSPGRRPRKPKTNTPVANRQPRPMARTSAPASAPVCKPTSATNRQPPRQSRLAGFGLSCHVEGCDGGANCLHI
mmetsp:Transcript_24365/g.59660  ORF Transcript_24365/g.59660 Transcript_24365/m.59660 type:complete len:201 (+) Transcript_24365:123-725(+)